jgi:hypothetical protein
MVWKMHGKGRAQSIFCPRLTVQVLGKTAAEERALGIAENPAGSTRPFSRRERLMLHVLVFFIGGWNLIIINLSRSPDHVWFWPWLGAWSALLVGHLVVVLVLSLRESLNRRQTIADSAHRLDGELGLDLTQLVP